MPILARIICIRSRTGKRKRDLITRRTEENHVACRTYSYTRELRKLSVRSIVIVQYSHCSLHRQCAHSEKGVVGILQRFKEQRREDQDQPAGVVSISSEIGCLPVLTYDGDGAAHGGGASLGASSVEVVEGGDVAGCGEMVSWGYSVEKEGKERTNGKRRWRQQHHQRRAGSTEGCRWKGRRRWERACRWQRRR